MRNIRLDISYDGTHYLGWQKTKMGPSIEETLERTLKQILQHPISLQAASRTDAGVHARGQVTNFFTPKEISLDRLQHSLNCLLPPDIAITSISEAEDGFHPTLDAKGKEYHYHLCYGRVQLPQCRRTAWHYPTSLNIHTMREAVPLLLGHRDFSAFCNVKKNSNYTHYTRYIESISLQECDNECIQFRIEGNHFLYKMVRNLVGTLTYVGCGKIALDNVQGIVSGGDRTQAGMTAPALGLFLHCVKYEGQSK
jgi:tRNA pseudouridine38-40 synthase